ncbi:MAG: restriction endonuclease [Planctomycetes bacterium]|nr:restriction endonuclease [Planctomycetota bacterium]
MSFTLNNLTETEFESFCFDLLQSLDFVNLSWRKGTGLTSSPSDQGRDIQGEILRKEIDGKQYHEKWFIECKHYVKGVPPDKIQGSITWANSERPDVLLFVVSNFLSNPTKNYLDEYQKNNKPSYRIKIWELKDLENLTAEKKELRIKYRLPTNVSFLPILNNYHLIYSIKPQLNTIEYFLELMETLDPKKRDEVFFIAYFDIVKPRFREATTGNEKLIDLKIDADDFEAFREKCLKMKSELSPTFVHKLVSSTLAWLFNIADKTSLSEMQKTQQHLIEQLEYDIASEKNEEHRKKLIHMLDLPKKTLKDIPERVENSYQLYLYICDELVRKLLSEKPSIFPI